MIQVLFNKVLTQGQEVTWELVLSNFLVSREFLIPRQLFSLRLHEHSSLQFPQRKESKLDTRTGLLCLGPVVAGNAHSMPRTPQPKGQQGPDVSESQCHAPYRI